MGSELKSHGLRKSNVPAAGRALGAVFDNLTRRQAKPLALHPHDGSIEVDVPTAQSEQLALTEASQPGEKDQRPVRLRDESNQLEEVRD